MPTATAERLVGYWRCCVAPRSEQPPPENRGRTPWLFFRKVLDRPKANDGKGGGERAQDNSGKTNRKTRTQDPADVGALMYGSSTYGPRPIPTAKRKWTKAATIADCDASGPTGCSQKVVAAIEVQSVPGCGGDWLDLVLLWDYRTPNTPLGLSDAQHSFGTIGRATRNSAFGIGGPRTVRGSHSAVRTVSGTPLQPLNDGPP